MPGAWELKQSNSVLCAILHTEQTTVAWAFGLRNLIIPGRPTGLVGMPYDMARNVACQHVLQHGFQYVFFLDSDVVPPHDAILRLMAHKQPIVSGLYCRRSPPVGIPVAIRDKQWVTSFRDDVLNEVDVVGAGCLLIHRSVLETLPPLRPGKPWFWWAVDQQGLLPEGEALSEDFSFCLHARKNGYKIYLDSSIKCKHVGNAEATFLSFQALEATPVT